MNRGSTSPRSRWRRSKSSAARIRPTSAAARDASFQYDYQLRIIGRDAIGQDVNVPPLTISYRVHSRVGAAAKLEGRDLSYLLPAMPIRVLSLVPADATDIRDASEASLATVDAWRSRSRLFELLALALGALAAVMIVLALVPLARQARSKTSSRSRAGSRSRGVDACGRSTDRTCRRAPRVTAGPTIRLGGARRDSPRCGGGDRPNRQSTAAPQGWPGARGPVARAFWNRCGRRL